jgi:hypothetical protein
MSMPINTDGLLAITIKLKVKENVRTATMLLFGILQKISWIEVAYFPMTYYHM